MPLGAAALRDLRAAVVDATDPDGVARLSALAARVELSDLLSTLTWIRGNLSAIYTGATARHVSALPLDEAAATILAAHRSGYVREAALRALPRSPAGAVAAACLADDHVPQVRDPAARWLAAAPVEHLAYTAGPVFAPSRFARGSWRADAAARLSTPAGLEALAAVARTARGALAVAAATPEVLTSLHDAVEPRVRALAAHTDLAVALRDPHPLVRRVAVERAPLADIAPLLVDPSPGVRRRAAVRLSGVDAAWVEPPAPLLGRFLDSLAVARRPGAADRALEALDAAPRAALQALIELGELSDGDLLQLARDPATVRLAVRALVARRRVTAAVLRELVPAEGPPHPAVVWAASRAPFWEGAEVCLRAVGLGWPGGDAAVRRFTHRAQRALVQGWTRPSEARVDEIRAAFRALPPPAADVFRLLLV